MVGEHGLILHHDGRTWAAMSSPVAAWLAGVWGSGAEDVYTVGYNREGGEQQGVIFHYSTQP